MYGAIANGGEIDGRRYLSAERVSALTGRRSLRPDRNLIMPLAFHLGFMDFPSPAFSPDSGTLEWGSFGWAIPESGLAFAMVHNRLLTPLVVSDQAGFIGTAALVRRGAAEARKRGFRPVVGVRLRLRPGPGWGWRQGSFPAGSPRMGLRTGGAPDCPPAISPRRCFSARREGFLGPRDAGLRLKPWGRVVIWLTSANRSVG